MIIVFSKPTLGDCLKYKKCIHTGQVAYLAG